MGKWCLQASSFIFDRIFIKLAGNQDSHKISDEFEFRLDRIRHFGVTCPCGWIKFSIDILWCLHLSSVVFDPILFILAGNEEMHKISDEFDFQPDWTTNYGVSSHRLIMGKWFLQASSLIFYRIFVKLAGNQDSHKISDGFQFWLDRICHFVTCPCGRIKSSIDILWCLHLFSVVFDPILFTLAGNEDMHKISDEFDFQPDWTTDYGVSYPWASKNFPLTYNGKMVSPS